jgi:hypothetical protein
MDIDGFDFILFDKDPSHRIGFHFFRHLGIYLVEYNKNIVY